MLPMLFVMLALGAMTNKPPNVSRAWARPSSDLQASVLGESSGEIPQWSNQVIWRANQLLMLHWE